MGTNLVETSRDWPDHLFNPKGCARPSVVLDKISHWPATHRWTPLYLSREYGHATIAVEFYDTSDRGTFLDQTAADLHKTMLFGAYLTGLNSSDARYAMREDLALFDLFPQIFEELGRFSPFWPADSLPNSHYRALWIGPANYLTGLHTDPGDTLLFQLYGTKHVILFPPYHTDLLYPEELDDVRSRLALSSLNSRLNAADLNVLKENVKWAKVDVFNPDTQRFPRFPEAERFDAYLHPGDTLYIPDQWWHAVRALEPTISVSIEPSQGWPSRLS